MHYGEGWPQIALSAFGAMGTPNNEAVRRARRRMLVARAGVPAAEMMMVGEWC
jgi:hypothetical protein